MSFQRTWDGTFPHPDNLVEIYENAMSKFAKNRKFGTKDAQGNYQWVTHADIGKRVDLVRGGMAHLGVTANDSVGIIAFNRGQNGLFVHTPPLLWAHILSQCMKRNSKACGNISLTTQG